MASCHGWFNRIGLSLQMHWPGSKLEILGSRYRLLTVYAHYWSDGLSKMTLRWNVHDSVYSLLLNVPLAPLPPTRRIESLQKSTGCHLSGATSGLHLSFPMVEFIDCPTPRSCHISAPPVANLPIFRLRLHISVLGSSTSGTYAPSQRRCTIWLASGVGWVCSINVSGFPWRRRWCTGGQIGRQERVRFVRNPTVWGQNWSLQSPKVLLAHSREIGRVFY